MTGTENIKKSSKPIKRTVAIHPIMDSYIRETWSLLVKDELVPDATYSAALNFMLLGAIEEAKKEGGWTEETRDTVWDFAHDLETMGELNLLEALAAFKEKIVKQEFQG